MLRPTLCFRLDPGHPAFTLSRCSVGLTLITATLLIGCGARDEIGEMRLEVSQADLQLCQDRMQLTIPAMAETVGIWQQETPQPSIKLKLRMSRTDLQRLLDSSPFAGKNLSNGQSASFGPNVDWWDPGRVKDLQIGHTKVGDSQADLSIGIDYTTATEAVVYLAWYKS